MKMKKRVSVIICLILMCLVPFSACNQTSSLPHDDDSTISDGNDTSIGGNADKNENNGNSDDTEDKNDDASKDSDLTEDTETGTIPPPATDGEQTGSSDNSTDVPPSSDNETSTQIPEAPPTDTENNTGSDSGSEETKTIKVLSITSPIMRNNIATVKIQGLPSTEYVIKVYYSSGASTAKGLEAKTSDENGEVSWSWKVGVRTKAGKYRIVIQGGGEKIETYFEVTE